MHGFYRLAVLAAPLLGTVLCEEPASPTKDARKPIYASANEAFRELLNALPEESLHVALNELTHFRDGVFESNHHGVESVHNEDPPLATRLIVAAVEDLKKRQVPSSANDTTTPTPAPESVSTPAPEQSSSGTPPPQQSSSEAPPPQQSSSEAPPPQQSSSEAPTPQQSSSGAPAPEQSSSETPAPEQSSSGAPSPGQQSSDAPPPPPESSREPAVAVPVPVSITDKDGQVTVVSTQILSQPTASVAVTITRTNSQGKTEVVQETKPAVVFTATNTAGSTFVTTSAVEFAPTRGQVLTSTNEEGSTFVTTYTPPAGRVSSVKLITTTGSNGQASVITSYTYVEPAAVTGPADQPPPSETASGRPGLQSGAADKNRAMDVAVMGGAIGGALAFWI